MNNFNLNEIYEDIRKRNVKFIIITGGVLSGLGKGVAGASVCLLLSQEYKMLPIKCDGYLNYDPGTMNPIEHGEVFVMDDGTEVDMDFGHYERFLNISSSSKQNLTMGKIYKEIIDLEREGKFLGKTVKLIPEVTDYIEQRILTSIIEHNAEIVLLEIGGTVGDIENELYIYACKNIKQRLDKGNVINIHLTYIPELSNSSEQKTKPSQMSIGLLMERGIIPDIIMCRSNRMLDEKSIEKLATYTGLERTCIISDNDVDPVYEIPINFRNQGLDKIITDKLNVKTNQNTNYFIDRVNKIKQIKESVDIGICGKYTNLNDSYVSIIEALTHSSALCNMKANIHYIDTTDLDINKLNNLNGIIIPGGFGSRGVEGKIKAIEFARKNNIPFLGLCYGLHMAVIEFARNVCGLKDANTTEVDPETEHPVIDILKGQDLTKIGGTMRLGSYKAILKKGSRAHSIYLQDEITERHRHRYEVNPCYHKLLEENGMTISGRSPDGKLAEFIEISNHPFFIATQAHPELKSKLLLPHPLFVAFLDATIKKQKK